MSAIFGVISWRVYPDPVSWSLTRCPEGWLAGVALVVGLILLYRDHPELYLK